ncbi:hypothetical protein HQ496_07540 [bacterium]|nr:hypothetical protein [bacterium]
MIKEVVRAMETGSLAYIGLFAFIFAFVLVIARVMIMKKKEREEIKNLPLDEPTEFYLEKK